MHAYLSVCEYECSDLVFSVKAFLAKPNRIAKQNESQEQKSTFYSVLYANVISFVR